MESSYRALLFDMVKTVLKTSEGLYVRFFYSKQVLIFTRIIPFPLEKILENHRPAVVAPSWDSSHLTETF